MALGSTAGTAIGLIASGGDPLIAAAGAKLGGQVDKAVAQIEKLGDALTSFVKLANPAVFNRYELAIENLNASLGALFAPVLSFFVPVVNSLNQAITSLQPELDAWGDTLKDLKEPLQDVLSAIFALTANGFSAFLEGLRTWAEVFKPVINDMKTFLQLMSIFADFLSALLGRLANGQGFEGITEETLNGKDKRNSAKKTTAVQPGGIFGIEEIGQQFRQAALQQGAGGSPMESIASTCIDIRNDLRTLINGSKTAAVVADVAVKEGVGGALSAAAGAVNPLFGALVDAGRRLF